MNGDNPIRLMKDVSHLYQRQVISKENQSLEEAQELSKRRNWNLQTQNNAGLSLGHLKDSSGHHKKREIHLQFKCSQKP